MVVELLRAFEPNATRNLFPEFAELVVHEDAVPGPLGWPASGSRSRYEWSVGVRHLFRSGNCDEISRIEVAREDLAAQWVRNSGGRDPPCIENLTKAKRV